MRKPWAYNAAVYDALPFGLWPAGPATADQWLVLALIVSLLGFMAQLVDCDSDGYGTYGRPCFQLAWLAYGWTLLGTLVLLAQDQPFVAWIFLVLAGGLFPLLRPLQKGVKLRGVGVALLITLTIASALGYEGLWHKDTLTVISWAYGLWAIANFMLPRFNARYPHWAVATDSWPWLGLVLLTVELWAVSQLGNQANFLPWNLAMILAVYMFLMLRNSVWTGFAWGAVFALTWAGLALSVARHLEGLHKFDQQTVGAFAVESLLLANLLLLGARLWKSYNPTLALRLRLRQSNLHTPLLVTAYVICSLWLLAMCLWDGILIFMPTANTSGQRPDVILGLLLSVSMLHGFNYWPTQTGAQLLITSVFLTVLAAWHNTQLFHMPLALALWGVIVMMASPVDIKTNHRLWHRLQAALRPWLLFSPLISLISLILVADISIIERLLTLAMLIGIAGGLGWRYALGFWMYSAATMIVILFHGMWFLWVSPANALGLLPWYGLKFAVITWGLHRLHTHASEYANLEAKQPSHGLTLVGYVLITLTPWLGGLAFAEWTVHSLTVISHLLSAKQPPGLGGVWSAAAAVVTAMVFVNLGIQSARRSNHSAWIYGVVLMAVATGVYCRLRWVGLAPVSVWDTAAIMTAAYGLLILQQLTLSRPVLNLVLVMPLFALATVPFQLGSAHAGLTLLATGALYLLTRRATGMNTPMYLALLALNVGIYLWVPGWAEHSGLLQVYLIPAALSVLWLLHLHRHELKPGVLKSARLAALTTLYAAITLDVFLQEALAVFVLALLLSIMGILLGIALRTRAFLYAGVSFLVLNVLGQILQLYPEQRLGRALVLMGLGAGITGLMIWFNIKREVLLERIRIFRADLETWE